MTDETLDQILKQALAPDIDDSEIQIRRKAVIKKMNIKKLVASGLAACAVLSLIVAGGYLYKGSQTSEGTALIAAPEHDTTSTNLFAITAYAAELPEGTKSGDVIGLRLVEAGYGTPDFLEGRFTISGQNIDTVKMTTDKCNLYTTVPIRREDPDFGTAEKAKANDHELYEPIYKGDPETDGHVEYYEHSIIVGQSYEGDYNDQMTFGMSVPKKLQSTSDDPKNGYWEDVDQVNGAILTVEVIFKDGNSETHRYKLNTGKIYIPVGPDDELQWDNLTRFLTAEEEDHAPFAYGYLIEKMD